jgi:hypothetical protein
MKHAFLIAICILCSSMASADVTIQNSYYTTGHECKEDTFLNNIDYLNTISIDQGSIYVDSQSEASDESSASLRHNIRIDPYGDSKHLDLDLNGKDIGCSKLLGVGFAGVSFSLSSDLQTQGNVRDDLYARNAHFRENINLVNSKYSGSLQVHQGDFFTSGKGSSFLDAGSHFGHIMELLFSGKQFKIDASLTAGDNSQGDSYPPVIYEWDSSAGKGTNAGGSISILANQGNRNVDSKILGTSTTLSDKIANPSPMGPGEGELRQLYMQYTIRKDN